MADAEGKILLCQTDGGKVTVVRFEAETFWATQKSDKQST
jgi:hypothetical protein